MGLLLCLLVIVITVSSTLGQTPYQECGKYNNDYYSSIMLCHYQVVLVLKW